MTGCAYVPSLANSTGSALIVRDAPGSVAIRKSPRNQSIVSPDRGDVSIIGALTSGACVVVVMPMVVVVGAAVDVVVDDEVVELDEVGGAVWLV